MRIRNFESSRLKVNDLEGNPIEIAAVVVWRVVDTAEACFEVDDYNNYVHVQSESALRNLATSYPYDAHDEAHTSLRGHTGVVAEHLKREIQERLAKAGVEVLEARISHLAYAPEIAAAMLQRQQAGAIIAARSAHRRRRGRHGGDGARDAVAQGHRAPRRGAQGGDGQQPAGRAVRREAARQPIVNTGHDLSVTRRAERAASRMADRKPFLLRIDPEVLDAVQRWANDDLRSLNGQIEFLLRKVLRQEGRLADDRRAEAAAKKKAPREGDASS